MDKATKAANLTAAFTSAATVFTNPTVDLSEGAPADIASSMAELAAGIYAEMNALFEGEGLEAATTAAAPAAPAAKKSGGWGSGGGSASGSGDDPATEKQVGFVAQLLGIIHDHGGNADVDVDDVKKGTKAEASKTIESLIALRDSLEG